MKLVTFGCSWIYGDEILPNTSEYRNSVNIGGVIQKEYNFSDYINFGNNSASNERILHQIFEYKNSKYYDESDFLLIGLSGLSRRLDYINYSNFPMTIPGWEKMHVKDWNHGPDFHNWFDLHGKYTLNDRNELSRYGINMLAIKSIIKTHKHLVFQSIDNIFKVYDNLKNETEEWMDVPIDYSVNGNESRLYGTSIFDIEKIKKEITYDLNENQNWINFEIPSWFDILKELDDVSYFANERTTNHPGEKGSKYFLDNYLKKYLDKIL